MSLQESNIVPLRNNVSCCTQIVHCLDRSNAKSTMGEELGWRKNSVQIAHELLKAANGLLKNEPWVRKARLPSAKIFRTTNGTTQGRALPELCQHWSFSTNWRGLTMSIERIQTGSRMSQSVIHNRTVYLSGQVALGAVGGNVAEQTKDILSRIDALLAAAKTDKSKILSATIWLTDMSAFSEMNGIWDAWVVPGATPARATVESPHLASSDFKVEIAQS
jgi:enamine deaminase RidA (YjgF/YER057c/UK114 family)